MTIPVPIAERLVSPLLLSLRDCLVTELARSPAGPVCRAMIVHSLPAPVMDGCSCECEQAGDTTKASGRGDAYLRVLRVEPEHAGIAIGSTAVAPQSCLTGWQVIIAMSTHRCIPVSDTGEPFPPEVVTDTALELAGDLAAMMRVLRCCPALDDLDLDVEFGQPIGPNGDCAGWELNVRISVIDKPPFCA